MESGISKSVDKCPFQYQYGPKQTRTPSETTGQVY